LRRVRVCSTGGAQRGADGVFVLSELTRGTADTGPSENLQFDDVQVVWIDIPIPYDQISSENRRSACASIYRSVMVVPVYLW
jgi:hypothetical protein